MRRSEEMKKSVFMFQLTAVKMFKPELDKGERNPYTKGDEIGNPYMRDIKLDIEEEHIKEVLKLLESKGYDVSKFN
jgi:hypothetical protein